MISAKSNLVGNLVGNSAEERLDQIIKKQSEQDLYVEMLESRLNAIDASLRVMTLALRSIDDKINELRT